MSYENRSEIRKAVLQLAHSVDPSIEIDEHSFNLSIVFPQPDYLGVMGVATTLVKGLSIMDGVNPETVDELKEHALQFNGAGGVLIAVSIYPTHAALSVSEA